MGFFTALPTTIITDISFVTVRIKLALRFLLSTAVFFLLTMITIVSKEARHDVRTKSLRNSILIGCFFNLILALTHWAGIINSYMLINTNYILSSLIILLVLINAITLTHHPEINLSQRQQVWLLNFAALLIAFLTEWL